MLLENTSTRSHPALQRIESLGVLPVITILDASLAPQLGDALCSGGLPIAEITLRTGEALAAIAAMKAHCPDMIIGAGTVLSVAQAKAAIDAGATFIVTPGFDAVVVDYCLAHGTPIVPGVMTPTEINMARSKGLRLLKFFPAEVAGGTRALRALSAPYRDLKFIPTGGITPENLQSYLRLPQVFACGGSWLAPGALLASGQFKQITRLASEAVAEAARCRA